MVNLRAGAAALLWILFAAFLGVFSRFPTHRPLPIGTALVRISFQHAAERVEDCVQFSPSELARLAPNMRRAQHCPRQRVPLGVELSIDGETRYRADLPPTGLAADGPARLYATVQVAAGEHLVSAKLRDSRRTTGFDYVGETHVTLAAGEALLIDFDKASGRISFLR